MSSGPDPPTPPSHASDAHEPPAESERAIEGAAPTREGRAPKGVQVGGRRVQKARAGQGVDAATVAKFSAARAFLLAEWFGASLMVVSFTLLYALAFATAASATLTVAVCLGLLAIGGWIFWSNHKNYRRIEFPWAQRWDTAAIVAAGTGAFFWGLFAFLQILTFFGYPVGPR